jgi:aspartate aminotransferase-like enzyme
MELSTAVLPRLHPAPRVRTKLGPHEPIRLFRAENIAIVEEPRAGRLDECLVDRRRALLAEACRRAVRALGLEILCKDPAECSNTLTAVLMPEPFDSDELIRLAYRRLELSLGVGLGAVKGRVFRIGHLGSVNELDLLGGLAGVEMALKALGVPVKLGAGLAAAQEFLLGRP